MTRSRCNHHSVSQEKKDAGLAFSAVTAPVISHLIMVLDETGRGTRGRSTEDSQNRETILDDAVLSAHTHGTNCTAQSEAQRQLQTSVNADVSAWAQRL